MTTTAADRAAVSPRQHATPGVPQLTPLYQTTFAEQPGWVRRFGVLASDAEYVYVPLYHGGQMGHEHDSAGPGELVLLRRDGLAEHRRVQVGWQPSRVAVDTRNERVYVVNYGQQSYSLSVLDRVKLLDGDPAPLIAEVPLEQAPIDVAVDQRRGLAYVTSTFQKKLHVVDGATGAERSGEAVSFADGPIGVAYDEGTDMIYVTAETGVGPSDTSRVIALDAATRQVQAEVRINPAAVRNRLVTVLPAESPRFTPAQHATTQQVWISRLGGGQLGQVPGVAVVEFDFGGGHANTGTFRRIVPLPGAVGVVAADRHQRHVHATSNAMLSVIDVATRAVIAEHEFTDGAGQPVAVHALDVSPADSRIYVAGGSNGTVYEFDPRLWPVVRPRAPLGAELGVAKADADQNLYVFVVGDDQVMRVARRTDALDDQDWSDWLDLPGGTFPLRAPIAAVTPGAAGRWQAFAVDTAGRLLTVGGTDTTADGPWAALPGQEARSFPPRAHVTAVSWAANQWLVFAIDSAGEVYSAATRGDGSISWGTLPGETFAPGAPIAAVSRKTDHWDLVAFHPDGRMRTIWKGSKGGVQPWGSIGNPNLVFRPGTRITMVGRNDRQLDVFAVGPDGDLLTIFWSGGWSDWGSLGGQFSHEHQIGATGRNDDALDVAAFDHDGQLLLRRWGHDEGWNPQWDPSGTPRWGVVEPTVALLDNVTGPGVPWLHAIWPAVDGSVHHAWWTRYSGRWSLDSDIDHVVPTPSVRRRQHISEGETDANLWGDVDVRLWSDGTYAVNGRVHDSGIDPYDYAVQVTARSNVDDFALTSYQAGDVDGDFPPGGDNDDFWGDLGVNSVIARSWPAFTDPVVTHDAKAKNTGFGGFISDLPRLLVEWVGTEAFFGPGAAAAAVIGKALAELAEKLTVDGEIVGVFAQYGSVFALSPYGIVPLAVEDFVEGVVLRELIGLRELHPHEKEFARKVFNSPDMPGNDTLPFDRMRITKLSNFGRGLVTPLFNGTILLNLGPGVHEDPVNSTHTEDYPEPGQFFVHELVHAWQVEHSFTEPTWAGASLVEHLRYKAPWLFWINGIPVERGDDPYEVPDTPDARGWGAWGYEQQARLIDKWYAAFRTQLDSPEAMLDWRFGYVRDHLRLGRR
jgi:DNA-binding beta-propeller fold protein YncE